MTRRDEKPTRTVSPKLWTATGVTLLTGLMALPPAAIAASSGMSHQAGHHGMAMPHLTFAASEGGEGGEGGEDGNAAAASMDDAAFIAALGFIEGHLTAGTTLYAAGHKEMAITHMKHPGDEIYTGLEPALKARGIDGFADELAGLAGTVESGKSASEVDTAFKAFAQSLSRTRDSVAGGDRARFKAMVQLVRTAAEEYEIGVRDGQIVNMHEYQDAWGFLQVARSMALSLQQDADAGVAGAAQQVVAEIDKAQANFDGIAPDGKVSGDASDLFGAAARIELAGLKVK